MNLFDVPRGLLSSDIEKLPSTLFASCELGSGEPVPECIICISEFQDGDRLRVLECMHKFHAKCIDRWLTVSAQDQFCFVTRELLGQFL